MSSGTSRDRGAQRREGPDSLQRSHVGIDERIERVIAEMTEHVCPTSTPPFPKQPYNMSAPLHREMTEALHRMAYGPLRGFIRVVYQDGSPGPPFPVGHLSGPDPACGWQDGGRSLHIGTLSFRHLDYDRLVDMYLLRDRETRQLTQGQIDQLAQKRMERLLSSPALAGTHQVVVFQAGLEPLVVGLYRALVMHLMKFDGVLCVTPVFGLRDGGSWVRGATWAGGRAP